jgi:hypothetical protein
MKERPDLIARGLCTMGYRLVPTKIQLPATIRAGEPFHFVSEWTNRAVGRAMRDYTLRLTLTDATGHVIATTDAGPTGCDRWIQGQTYPLTQDVTFRDVRPGQYDLRLSLIDPRTNRPIALSLKDGDAEKRYQVTTITIP